MTCDLLVLNFSSNVTLVTAIVTTPQSVSVVVSVTVQGPRSKVCNSIGNIISEIYILYNIGLLLFRWFTNLIYITKD